MNEITGKITHKESGLGVPDLLVVVYDLDPDTRPEELALDGASFTGVERTAGSAGLSALGDRICSVATNAAGEFGYKFEDAEFRIRDEQEKRPDLLLMVVAPEETGQDPNARILHFSLAVRQNAGRFETFLIRLSSDQLTKAGIPLPTLKLTDNEPSESVLVRLAALEGRREAMRSGLADLTRKQLELDAARLEVFHNDVKPQLIKDLSSVTENLVNPERLVLPGQSVLDKSVAVMADAIRTVVNDPAARAPRRGFVSLSDDQRQELEPFRDADGFIDEMDMAKVLGPSPSVDTQNGNAALIREDPLVKVCRDLSQRQRRAAALLNVATSSSDEGTGDDADGTGAIIPDDDEITKSDIKRHLSHLMSTLTSPEEQVVNGLTPRSDKIEVERQIKQLSLERSPADTPAYFDFHNLQIAFEHVWQEVIDQKVVDLAEDAFDRIVALGADPGAFNFTGNVGRGFVKLGRRVARTVRDHRDGADGGDSSSWSGGTRVTDTSWGDARDHRLGSIGVADELPQVLQDLEQRIKEPFNFTIYAANQKERSINFGILLTYNQEWRPQAYQAGELVRTITLAPKQVQKISVTRKLHKKRYQKEVENNVRSWREETTLTARAEEEIVRRASVRTNFNLTTQHTFSVKVPGLGSTDNTVTSSFTRDASKSSDDIKKSFHEAVTKSAQDYKNERSTEVVTEETEDLETVETTEITNPNDEIAVTFLFYELQRRFRVIESLHKITPVILVAQEVPRPDEIDNDWLMTYDWILRRVLLDDSFLPALEYLTENIAGDDVALAQMKLSLKAQNEKTQSLRAIQERLQIRMMALKEYLRLLKTSSFLDELGHPLFSEFRKDKAAVEDALQGVTDDINDVAGQIGKETEALNTLVSAYSEAFREHVNHLTQIARLRIHVKQNILFYMQAIWGHEPPDQRFFRLHNTKTPVLRKRRKSIRVDFSAPRADMMAAMAHRTLPSFGPSPVRTYEVETKYELHPDFDQQLHYVALSQVADLEGLLGFKGNYAVFPLKESNALTDFMMAPYIDHAFNALVDPDDLGNWSLEDFSDYVCCLRDQLDDAEFNQIKDQLQAQFKRLLTASRRADDMVTVPSGSLFIEALPATHSLIEEFKARHRAVDVKRAQAEVRKIELENVRYAARVLGGELEDPEVEKKVVVEGPSVILPTDDN
ncbi:hypothetical protein [Ensifer sp.]|jgi:hypothetical protein|uniref:hypothetical protein n=1 Tax=Ensifer sp. TaxID=1872086 RepID=UPI002E102072|nr:hypothetical protein [Ensifer sp.]